MIFYGAAIVEFNRLSLSAILELRRGLELPGDWSRKPFALLHKMLKLDGLLSSARHTPLFTTCTAVVEKASVPADDIESPELDVVL